MGWSVALGVWKREGSLRKASTSQHSLCCFYACDFSLVLCWGFSTVQRGVGGEGGGGGEAKDSG